MTARVLVVGHLAHEHSGVLGEVLERHPAVEVVALRAWEGGAIPSSAQAWDGIAVLGGDMDTDQDDVFGFLAEERRLLAAAVDAEVPTLALCLGAQLLAEATGGSVAHGVPEIGYVAVDRLAAAADDPLLQALPSDAHLFNAHRDQISAGPTAVVLARTAMTPVAAFRVGSCAWGLQFHPEVDASYVAAYVEAPGIEAYLRAHGWTPARLLAEARRRNEEHRAAGTVLLGAWVDQVVGRSRLISTGSPKSAVAT